MAPEYGMPLDLDGNGEVEAGDVSTTGAADVRAAALLLDRDVEAARAALLRRCLWNGTLARRRQAIAALGALRVASVVPDLIALLGAEDPGVGVCAQQALRSLAGTNVGGGSAERWYDDEQAWRAAGVPGLAQLLRHGEPGPVVRALRDAQPHPLLRNELESILPPHISHREPSVAAEVCRVLATLDCRGALDELEGFAATSGRVQVVAEARRAVALLSR